MKNEQIPKIVISRLPIYIQALNQLLRDNKTVISSMELGEILGITSSQIRKDLSHFGGFGKQGTGYDIILLMESLREILNLNQIWQIVVVGVGHIGQALLNYDGFGRKGFEIVAAYDNSPAVIGKKIGGIEVLSVDQMEEQICSKQIDIAAIAVPAEQAQQVCD
ncbi:MAG: redox-sensing transcriptional repressor Rex, partial [Anaerolineaceae bacterium]|nr:redox-sensing transcriptional repressor Rex [Anaerolineaceae bacterium]